MTILVIDTSGKQAQVAVVQDEDTVAHRTWENTPQVGPQLLEHIEAILQESNIAWDQVDRIAVHRGPRKEKLFFSGLRTGITTAILLASAKGKDVVGVSGESLEEMIAALSEAVPETIISPQYE
ncbi:MAG: tRNA (adenosine(37)-N6)-threonylcarbamoyltransferase complex dimerization subunit type 1 TsaB [Candidatus Andersenbacteria bacterium]